MGVTRTPEERARGITSSLELWARANAVRLPDDVIEELEQLIRLAIQASVEEARAEQRPPPGAAQSPLDAPFETASWIVPNGPAAPAPPLAVRAAHRAPAPDPRP